ncbi:MAG TPA: PIG-L family deacetylase, partial [Candidatus Eisenbacteria bacterium]|nr:PIG-L family deacetylase [Candidatus Eisenbacteria bacterium]
EPNRLDLATPAGVGYVLARGSREAARWLRRRAGLVVDPRPSLRGRRPSRAHLAAMLAALRFEVTELAYERAGGAAARLPAPLAPWLVAVARARPSVAGIHDPWPERDAHCRAYERAQAHLLATRDAWLRAHPERAPGAPAPFEPATYAGRTVLVLAPHPDDEVIGAGGAMLRLARAGARVVCVQATDGSAGAAMEALPAPERREARLAEARAVADAAGVAALELWRDDNAAFRATPERVERLRALLARERPVLVLLPFVTEAHADHVELAVILARALAGLAPPLAALVLGYEVWSVTPPTHVHDVTPLMGELEALLHRYDLAMRVDDFVHFCADRALYHGFRLRGAPGYLEAFHGVPAADFPQLVRTVRPGDGD